MTACFGKWVCPQSAQDDEDAPPIAREDLIAAADGMGGRGAKKVTDKDGILRTNAYVASRLCLQTVDGFMTHDRVDGLFDALEAGEPEEHVLKQIASETAQVIFRSFEAWVSRYDPEPWIKQGALDHLPTTLAMILFREHRDAVDAVIIWAGDSRCWSLTSDGLAQLTRDHLNGDPDVLELLRQDRSMTNIISCSSPFYLSCRRVRVPKPCILLAASDGAFMYLPRLGKMPNALRLEYEILGRLNQTDMETAMEKLKFGLTKHHQDDVSVAAGFFTENGYEEILQMIRRRGDRFITDYADVWSFDRLQEEERTKRKEDLREQAQSLRSAECEALVRAAYADPCMLETHPAIVQARLEAKAHEQLFKAGPEKAAAYHAAMEKICCSMPEIIPVLRRIPSENSGVDIVSCLLAPLPDNGEDKLRSLRIFSQRVQTLQRRLSRNRNLARGTHPSLKNACERDLGLAIDEKKHALEELIPCLSGRAQILLAAIGDAGLKETICRAAPSLRPYLRTLQEEEEKDLFREKARREYEEELVRQAEEQVKKDPAALAAWMKEKGYSIKPYSSQLKAVETKLADIMAWEKITERQWERYKPGYERWFNIPEYNGSTVNG